MQGYYASLLLIMLYCSCIPATINKNENSNSHCTIFYSLHKTRHSVHKWFHTNQTGCLSEKTLSTIIEASWVCLRFGKKGKKEMKFQKWKGKLWINVRNKWEESICLRALTFKADSLYINSTMIQVYTWSWNICQLYPEPCAL